MDSPDRPPAGSAAAGAAAAVASPSEDSPVFNFINSLSPIPPPKPLDSAHNVQLFKSLDFAPVSSIFTSPHVNPQKESKLPIRDASAQLSQEGHSPNSVRTRTGTSSFIRLSRCTVVASEKCSITCSLNEASVSSPGNASILPSKLPKPIQLDGNSLESDKKQGTDGKTACTIDHECTKLAAVILDNNGRDKMDTSTSGRNVQESQLPEQHKDEVAACDWDYLITDHANGIVSKLDPSFEAEAQLVNETLKTDDIISCKSFLSTDDPNLENSRRKLFHGSSGSYIHNAADDPHIYWAGAVEGAATDYTPQVLPGACQSQSVSNDQICDKTKAPGDYMPVDHNVISQHLRGLRRRSLFNERAGASYMGVYTGSNLPASSTTARCKGISGDNYLKPVGTPMCALPGIGLHLNALAPISKDNIAPYDTQSTGNAYSNMPFGINYPPGPPLTSEQSCQINPVVGNELVPFISEVDSHILNDDSCKTTMCEKTDESGHDSPNKKRRKFESGDGDSCKRCSCKKSKCLKLYCECFAARIFCSESCSCIGCLNTSTHEETVLCTRKQIESRNPLAFAPKVIRTSEPGREVGQDSNKTPASARHKRGCNCKKSSCLKKYCECYQGGVGCSMSCRCEGCKNAFGRRDGVIPFGSEEIERGGREKSAREKEEKSEIDNLLVVNHTDLSSTELTTPLIESCRPLVMLPPTSSKLPLSSIRYSSRLYNSQPPLKADVVLSPFESYAEMILGDGPSDILKGDSSPCTSIKVVSPNKKRVSPPHIGTGLSPIGKSGRKLILKSIPSFPSLTGDVNNEHPVS